MSPRCIKGHACDHPIACPTCFPPPTAVSEMNRYVDAAEREAGENARLRAEVRALRRERRALRKALMDITNDAMSAWDEIGCQNVETGDCFDRDGNRCAMCDLETARAAAEKALKPRKARRRKA